MKDLLLYIARSLVEHPEQVSVTEVEEGDELTLQLRVAPEDMGKVIGRQAASPRRSALCAFLCPAHRRQGFGGYR